VLVRDLGSKNGTRLGGATVREVLLGAAATLLAGDTPLQIAFDEVSLGQPEGLERFGQAVTHNEAMRRLFGVLARVARSDAPVVISGETGTGKDLLARELHAASSRAAGPLVTVDCRALAGNLIESELFGHRRGAFTGATSDRDGAFTLADGGTLVLDGVGELPLDLQPKLLRAAETGLVQRLGDGRPQRVDVRLVSTAERDLHACVAAGSFRPDLLFRLAVVSVRVPPLRERREDIAPLARIFMQELGATDLAVPEALLQRFRAHSWPGNARELRNVVERVLADAPEPGQASAARTSVPPALPFKVAKEQLLEQFTRDYLAALLAECDGNVSEMARRSGLARTHMHVMLRKLGLKVLDG
jgi:DNA-binding NtrC family response regulator